MLTVITGPPCSGKSTYAREHAKPGDIIIDFDLLAQALGSPVGYGHPPQIAYVAAKAREGAIREAICQHRKGCVVWIVDTYPAPERRRQYAIAGAKVISCTASKDELHRRAEEHRPPEWHERIDLWLASNERPSLRSVHCLV
jgi:hypothetical protein